MHHADHARHRSRPCEVFQRGQEMGKSDHVDLEWHKIKRIEMNIYRKYYSMFVYTNTRIILVNTANYTYFQLKRLKQAIKEYGNVTCTPNH